MNKRKLGNSGLEVAPLALGCNVFGWTVDEHNAYRLLDEFVASGFNLIDTADIYGKRGPQHQGGLSESILGNWLQGSKNRSKVIIATKVGMEIGPEKKGLSKTYILQAVNDSLCRLKTDYIDLYQAHTDDPQTSLEETLEAFSLLIEQGKVRAIGASNYNAQRLSQALSTSATKGFAAYQTLQPLYNLYDRVEYETIFEPICKTNTLGTITYSSLASGFLTGKYRSDADLAKSPRGQMVKEYLNERGFRILRALDIVAKGCQSTPATISLAWLMARPGVTAAITSATNLQQLKEMINATTLTLDQSTKEFLDRASSY